MKTIVIGHAGHGWSVTVDVVTRDDFLTEAEARAWAAQTVGAAVRNGEAAEIVDATAQPATVRDDEVAEVGQEEVFSKTEIELGAIEHKVEAGEHKV